MQRAMGLAAVTLAILVLLPVGSVHAQEKKDTLSRLLKALAKENEPKDPKRGVVFALPQAVKILEAGSTKSYKKEDIRFRGMHTYSTRWNEAKLIKEFGKPDQTGKENVTVTGATGIAETRYSKMLRYGWLRIYVTPKGQIWYVGRKYR